MTVPQPKVIDETREREGQMGCEECKKAIGFTGQSALVVIDGKGYCPLHAFRARRQEHIDMLD